MRWMRNLSWPWRTGFGVVLVALLGAGGLVVLDGRSGGKPGAEVLGLLKKAPAVPTITSGPSDPTSSTSATLVFRTTPPPAGYLCKLDHELVFSPCSSPKTYSGPLDEGSHTFQVEAQDGVVLTSLPAVRTWMVDHTAPAAPTITAKPDNPSADTAPHFAYSDSEAGVTFQCQLDSAAVAACGSSVDYKKLSVGDHTFTVWAVDGAGNRSGPASYGWTLVDNKVFGISGSLTGLFSPGVQKSLSLVLTNPYNFPIKVTGVTVRVEPVTTKTTGGANPTCVGTENLTVITQAPFTSTNTVTVPGGPGGTYTLKAAEQPVLKMPNLPTNQDDCKNTTFTLTYTGTATK